MNTLDRHINGFNVIATYTHIEPSEILDENYKVKFRMLRPKLSVVFKYKGRSVAKDYTLSGYDLSEKVRISEYTAQRGTRYSTKKRSVLYVKDGDDTGIVYEEIKYGKRKAIYSSLHGAKAAILDDLKFTYKPTQEDLQYILRNLLSDQMMIWEYDVDEFAEMFMGDCSIESLRQADNAYNTLKNDVFQLNLKEEAVYNALEKLTEMGIE